MREYATLAFGVYPRFVLLVRSGASGTLLRTIATGIDFVPSHPGQGMRPLCDVDHDGVDEIALVGIDSVYAFSAVSGALVRTFTTPSMHHSIGEIAGLSDVTGDGIDDVAIGEPYSAVHCFPNGLCVWWGTDAGRVEILSGASGAIVRTIAEVAQPSGLGTMFGARVVDFGDFDHDGADDLLVSNYFDVDSAAPIYVDAYSGATGAQLFHMLFPTIGATFGIDGKLCALGDVDQDNMPDFAVGEPSKSRVHCFSGATQAKLFTVWGGAYFAGQITGFGQQLVSVDDMNGDGLRDLAISNAQGDFAPPGLMPPPLSATGYACVVSSSGGSELWTRVGNISAEGFTVTASLGDIDGDNKPELFAEHNVSGGAPSQIDVSLFSSRHGYSTPTNYCVSPSHISLVGSTSTSADDFTLAVQGPPANAPGYFFTGMRALGGGTGDLPCVFGFGLRLVPWLVTDAQGAATRPLPLANSVLDLAGTTWNFQFAYTSPLVAGQLGYSDALSVTFTP